MATFDENGNYIKTNWKAGDRITATKLNKIEESIEAVNSNDISRHIEADARLDQLESSSVTDKQAINAKVDALEDVVEANKDAADLEIYNINSHMTLLDKKIDDGVAEVEAIAETVDGKIAAAEANMTTQVNTAKDEMTTQVETAKNEMTAQVNQGKADMEAMVAEVEADMVELQNDISEIQNDIENAQTQTFAVTDAYKFTVDHDGMMPSLVTLNNIEGLSSVETNISRGFKFLLSREINHVCTINTDKNYFDDAVQDTITSNTTFTKEGNTVRVSGTGTWNAVRFNLPNLEEGKKYCIFCDNVTVTSGDSVIQVGDTTRIEYQTDYLRSTAYMDESSFNRVFLVNDTIPSITLHCSPLTTGGDVTYENIQIYEVKEMIVPDIRLNSLPNGVKDEIKDGMLIKRTNFVNLAELTWVPSSTNVQYPDSEFNVYYSKSVPDLIVDPDAWDTELGQILCNNIPSVPIIATTSADCGDVTDNRIGISGHKEWSELRIKVYRTDAPDLTSLNTWLTNNNVYAVYELATPEYVPINLTIKADKGDTVVINTTKTMNLTYDIQLNTRAQIDASQEQSQIQQLDLSIMRQHIDVLQQFVGGITLSYNDYKGCLNFPNGLKLQWGKVEFGPNYTTGDSIDHILTFQEPFKSNVLSFICSTRGADNAWDSICSGHPLSLDQARIVIRNINLAVMNGVYWLAIGM